MGLACPVFTVPAGTSLPLPGATYGFTVTLAGPGATWSEQGGSPIPLDATTYLPNSDKQPFGDILFTADATSPLRIYVAKSAEQAKRLQPPTGSSISSTIGTTGNPAVTEIRSQSGNFLSVTNGGAFPSAAEGSNNQSRVASGTATTSPATVVYSGVVGGIYSGVTFCNTATVGNLLILNSAGTVIWILLPSTCVVLPIDINLSTLQVESSTGTVTYTSVALIAS